MSERDMLEKHGRLTSGNKPLHERRKQLTDVLRDAYHMVNTMIDKWPAEYGLPTDHPIFELLEVINIVCDDMEKTP